MTISGPTFDAEGLTLAWAKSVPGLLGKDGPVLSLLLTEDARSPQRGVIGTVSVGQPRVVDIEGLGDSAPTTFEFRAIGGEGGAKRQCERAARAFSEALRMLDGTPVLVTADGVTAKLSSADNVQGPAWMGSPGGEATYRVTATMVWQRA